MVCIKMCRAFCGLGIFGIKFREILMKTTVQNNKNSGNFCIFFIQNSGNFYEKKQLLDVFGGTRSFLEIQHHFLASKPPTALRFIFSSSSSCLSKLKALGRLRILPKVMPWDWHAATLHQVKTIHADDCFAQIPLFCRTISDGSSVPATTFTAA